MKIIFVWLMICAIWSSTWVFIKLGLQDLPPLSFAGTRFIVAFIIISLLIWIKKIPLPRSPKDWILIAGTGILTFGINYGFIFWGEQFVSSGLAAVLNSTIPAFGLALAPFHLQEKITPSKVSAILLGLCGVIVIFLEQLEVSNWMAFLGSIGIVIGAFAGAYSSILVKAFGSQINPFILTGGQTFFGFLTLTPIALITEGSPFNFHWTGSALISIFYLALIGSIVSFLLYYWLLQQIQATKALFICLVIPVGAIFLGFIFLHETLGWRELFGSLLVLTGIGLIVVPPQEERKEIFNRVRLLLWRKQFSSGE